MDRYNVWAVNLAISTKIKYVKFNIVNELMI